MELFLFRSPPVKREIKSLVRMSQPYPDMKLRMSNTIANIPAADLTFVTVVFLLNYSNLLMLVIFRV